MAATELIDWRPGLTLDKSPASSLRYSMSVADWLNTGDAVSGLVVTSADADVIASDTSYDDTTLRFRLTGGAAAATELVRITIAWTTNQADAETVSILIKIKAL